MTNFIVWRTVVDTDMIEMSHTEEDKYISYYWPSPLVWINKYSKME